VLHPASILFGRQPSQRFKPALSREQSCPASEQVGVLPALGYPGGAPGGSCRHLIQPVASLRRPLDRHIVVIMQEGGRLQQPDSEEPGTGDGGEELRRGGGQPGEDGSEQRVRREEEDRRGDNSATSRTESSADSQALNRRPTSGWAGLAGWPSR
jgi:hypothetical protein